MPAGWSVPRKCVLLSVSILHVYCNIIDVVSDVMLLDISHLFTQAAPAANLPSDLRQEQQGAVL